MPLRQTNAQNEFGGAMKELIEQIAKALVDNPEQVSVRLIEGEQTTVFELRVAQSDLGKVIGKQGRTASSIRTIISAAGMKLKKGSSLRFWSSFNLPLRSLLHFQRSFYFKNPSNFMPVLDTLAPASSRGMLCVRVQSLLHLRVGNVPIVRGRVSSEVSRSLKRFFY